MCIRHFGTRRLAWREPHRLPCPLLTARLQERATRRHRNHWLYTPSAEVLQICAMGGRGGGVDGAPMSQARWSRAKYNSPIFNSNFRAPATEIHCCDLKNTSRVARARTIADRRSFCALELLELSADGSRQDRQGFAIGAIRQTRVCRGMFDARSAAGALRAVCVSP